MDLAASENLDVALFSSWAHRDTMEAAGSQEDRIRLPIDRRRSWANVGGQRGESREHLAMDHGVSERESGGKSWVLEG